MAKEKEKHADKEQAREGHGKEGAKHVDGHKAAKAAGPKIHDEKEGHADIRYIVRIAAKDLDGSLPVERALQGIRGIGIRMAKMMADKFHAVSGVNASVLLGKMPEDKDAMLEDIVLHPQNHGVPVWAVNRRKDFFTWEGSHIVMTDLEFTLRKDLQLMSEIKSYKGLRHVWGLPVRGQRTRSTHRGKGPVVGVLKKDAKAAAAPAKAGPATAAGTPVAKKEEKKK